MVGQFPSPHPRPGQLAYTVTVTFNALHLGLINTISGIGGMKYRFYCRDTDTVSLVLLLVRQYTSSWSA